VPDAVTYRNEHFDDEQNDGMDTCFSQVIMQSFEIIREEEEKN